MDVALRVEGLEGLLWHVDVSHKDVSSVGKDLVRTLLQLHDRVAHGDAAGTDLPVVLHLVGDGTATLGLAVQLTDVEVEGGEEANHLWIDWGGGGVQDAGLVQAEVLLDLVQHQLLGEGQESGLLHLRAVLETLGHLHGLVPGPLGEHLLDAGELPDCDLHDLHHLLEDAGDGEENGGPAELEGLHEGTLQGIGSGQVDDHAGGDGGVAIDHGGGDVVQGKEAHHSVGVGDADVLGDDVHGPDDVIVAEHGALGVAGRAARVDDGGALAGLDLGGALLDLLVADVLSLLNEVFPVADAGELVLVGGQGGEVSPVVDDDALQVGESCTDLQDLVELLGALHQDHSGGAVVQHVEAGLRAIRGVDAGGAAARQGGGGEQCEVLDRVEADGGDDVEGLDAVVDKGLGELVGESPVFVEGDLRSIVLHDGHVVTVLADGVLEDLGEGGGRELLLVLAVTNGTNICDLNGSVFVGFEFHGFG